jgi:hypothetical protein
MWLESFDLNPSKKRKDNERGMFVIFFLVSFSVVLMIVGLAISTRILLTSKKTLQNTNNLAAFAAINEFFALNPDGSSRTALERKQAAVAAATGVLHQQDIWKSKFSSEDLERSLNTEVELGYWVTQDASTCPINDPDRCNCTSPGGCFILEPSVGEQDIANINAVRLNTSLDYSSFSLPFLRLAGVVNQGENQNIRSMSTAKLVQRCTVFLLDVSASGHFDSHDTVWMSLAEGNRSEILEFGDKPSGGYKITLPEKPGLFSYALSPSATPTNPGYSCIQDPRVSDVSMWEAYWCSMENTRPSSCSSTTCEDHYKSDYNIIETGLGQLALDMNKMPEPYRGLLGALNNSLRRLKQSKTGRDRIAVVPFSTQMINPFPVDGLSDNFDFMIDLTDWRRVGRQEWNSVEGNWETVGTRHPNAVDRGWFPSFSHQGTDIIGALEEGARRLTTDVECSRDSIKTIVIVTDGLPTVTEQHTPTYVRRVPLVQSSQDLFYHYFYSLNRQDTPFANRIGQFLQRNDIHVVPIVFGNEAGLNFKRVSNTSSGGYHSIEELVSLGYVGQPYHSNIYRLDTGYNWEYLQHNSLSHLFIWYPYRLSDMPPAVRDDPYCQNWNTQPDCSIRWAPLVKKLQFREAQTALQQLAINTFGYFCPIMEPYRTSSGAIDSTCYYADGKYKGWCHADNDIRDDWRFQWKSIYAAEAGGQALRCLDKVFASPPYELTKEWTN